MPIRKGNSGKYPKDWKSISAAIRKRGGNKSEWTSCSAVNGQPHPITGSRVVLTTA